MRSVELFAGAGGLAMGISDAGFTHEAVVEWDRYACDTIRENQRRGVEPVVAWPLHETDVRTFDYSGIKEGLDVIAGGPPCQPFSLGGRHGGWNDERDMFPEMVRAIRELKPRAVLIENVKGLLRQSFAKYFEYIVLQISYPEITIYYVGNYPAYAPIAERNRDGLFEAPIYVGKAIPAGARRGGGLGVTTGPVLFRRLSEHAQSIARVENLELSDFLCRYLVVDDIWIPLGESLLIERFAPVWNSTIDGFGNHDPGSERHNSQKPPWDVVHPGRPWAEKMRPNRRSQQEILHALSLRLSES